MDRGQKQFNLDHDARKVLVYWQSVYGVTPDAWELSNELEISEGDAEKSLERLATPQVKTVGEIEAETPWYTAPNVNPYTDPFWH